MAMKRLPMRKLREVLKLKYETGLPYREIAKACGTVSGVQRSREAGVSWPLPADLDERGLERRLFSQGTEAGAARSLSHWASFHEGTQAPRACRYDPQFNRTFDDFAAHYGAVVIPTRAGKPKDKAKVEVAVQVAQRWIVARLRNHTFFTLAELNTAIRELLVELNDRPMRRLGVSRRQRFESLDRPALKPLPRHRYGFAFSSPLVHLAGIVRHGRLREACAPGEKSDSNQLRSIAHGILLIEEHVKSRSHCTPPTLLRQ